MQAHRSDTPSYDQALAAIFALSERMLELAQKADWISLIQAESERQTLLRRLAALDMPAADSNQQMELMVQKLQAILDLNSKLIDLGHQACRDLSQQIRKISGGRRARRAYLSNSI
jgi:uncharacterized membrane protein YccC